MIELRVVGVPAPQGSKSAFVRGGKVVTLEGKGAGRQRFTDWRQAVATAARDYVLEHPQEAISEAVEVSVAFLFPLPAGDPYRTRHTTRPDIDKLARAVLDALVAGGVLADDSRVFSLNVSKRYTHGLPPGAVITLMPSGELEAADREELKRRAREQRRGAG